MKKTGCEIENENGTLRVKLLGEIDHHSCAYLREEIDKAMFRSRCDTVVMDLCAVTFMDSAGLGLILGRYAKITELGGRLVCVNPSLDIDKILRIAGVRKLITVKEERKII
ncbi:MAG: anti-sigma factor antagonist [Clostridia bacterium]|nr:anti-sigma factor antagonist [Clostridia bacterium]